MWPVDPAYAETVKSSNGLRVTVDVFRGGVPMYQNLPVVDGEVLVDSRSATRRACTLTLPPFLREGTYGAISTLPEATYDTAPPVLGISGHELRVTHSLVTSSGSMLSVPVGRFRVDTMTGSELGISEVTLTGVSREAWVVDDIFTTPRTVSGPSAAALIAQLIREVLPQAVVSVTATGDAGVSPTTEDSDRWGLITHLATQIGAVVYAAPDGRFVIEDAPTLASNSVWTFSPGEGRSLIDAHRVDSRHEVRNLVVVVGATPDGSSAPVTGMARDDDPNSSTLYGDPDAAAYGKAPMVLRLPGLTSSAACARVAAVELAKKTGTSSGLDLSGIPHAGLEALNVVDVVVGSVVTNRPPITRRHVVDSFVLPLTPAGPFPVATRDLRAVVLEAT